MYECVTVLLFIRTYLEQSTSSYTSILNFRIMNLKKQQYNKIIFKNTFILEISLGTICLNCVISLDLYDWPPSAITSIITKLYCFQNIILNCNMLCHKVDNSGICQWICDSFTLYVYIYLEYKHTCTEKQ